MTGPKFTAVIPAYNAAATLAPAIRSVQLQTVSDFELIVIDDGSQDETLELARSFSGDDRIHVVTQENKGLPGARNAGIARARGRYVGLLDADDMWMPTFLEAMGDALDANPEAGFAYTDGWSLDDSTGRIRRTTTMARQRPPADPPGSAEEFLRLLIDRNFIEAAGTIRKAALDEVGGYNETLRAVEDYELWLRLLAHGWAAVRPPGNLLVRRDTPTSMSKDPKRMWIAFHEAWRLVAEEHPAPDDVKATARAHMLETERELRMLAGEEHPRRALRDLRLAVGRAQRRVQGGRLYYDTPPPEVATLLAAVESPD